MFGTGMGGLGFEQQLPVERVLQDGLQTLIREGLELDRPLAGGFQPRARVKLFQPQDAQAGPIPHLGARFALKNGLDHLGRRRPDPFGPVDQPRGRPFQVRLVALGHVFGHGGVPVGKAVACV
jgi:hypothetical protein